MRLVVYELITTIYQTITVGTHSMQLAAIRPHLLRFGNPAGSLIMKVYDNNGGFIAASDTVAISAIGSGTYWHGYQRFLNTVQLKKSTSYRLQLESIGYSFSESGYIGWCNDYDLRKVTPNYSPSDGVNAPLDVELWEYVNQWRRAG